MQLLIYKSATYTDVIDKVDTVRAYHVRSPANIREFSQRFQPFIFRVDRYDLSVSDTVRQLICCIHQDYFVEVDIVMDAHTPLYKAHNVSERLQTKIEALPHVERAFVHVDYEWTHAPARHDINQWPPVLIIRVSGTPA